MKTGYKSQQKQCGIALRPNFPDNKARNWWSASFLGHSPCPVTYNIPVSLQLFRPPLPPLLFSSFFLGFPSNSIGHSSTVLRAVCRLSSGVFQPTHPLLLYHPLGHCHHPFFHLTDGRTLSFSMLNRSTDKNRSLKEKEYRVLFIGGWKGGLNGKTTVRHCFFHWFHS